MPDLLESSDAGRRNSQLIAPLEAPVSPRPPHVLRTETVLLFQHVSKWYGPVIGINQVTLELRPGITGLVGHNGSGKSTLLRLAAGQIRPDLGSVQSLAMTRGLRRRNGMSATVGTGHLLRRNVRPPFRETMAQLIGYPQRSAKSARGDAGTRRHEDRAERRLAGYSKGMRQRIKLAQALLHDPELLLLDEPLSGIDPIGRRESIALFKELARRGKCLLISSHELEELEKLTDHVAIMDSGRIAAVGTLTEIRDLLDDHPLSVRIACDQNRLLAGLLLELEEVVGIDRVDDYLLVRAKSPRKFFERLAEVVLDRMIEIKHLETQDESTHDVLGYLLGGNR